jgi:hypothetical protein
MPPGKGGAKRWRTIAKSNGSTEYAIPQSTGEGKFNGQKCNDALTSAIETKEVKKSLNL